MFNDTIAAISTPLQEGAISIVRMSGPDALAIADQVFSKKASSLPANTINYGMIRKDNKDLDEVLLSVFHGPRSFTAEDMVEINCHGGVFITRQILQLLLEKGARLAGPGEFTQRAFVNGRIDLAQAEAVSDMITASSSQAASLAMEGIKGSVRKLLEPLTEQVLNIIAQIEVNIDYPEYEDIEQLTDNDLLPAIRLWIQEIDEILRRCRRGQQVKNGLQTVIVGRPNVGKSSLLNALLEEDKAIVTDIPGTTRDIVEGHIHLNGLQLDLVDTAGIRKAKDLAEEIGISKSKEMAEKADLILQVLDASQPLHEEDRLLLEMTKGKKRLILLNKTDLTGSTIPDGFPEGISISASQNKIEPLLKALEQLQDNGDLAIQPVLSSERQIGLLESARVAMMNAENALEAGIQPDLAEIDIQRAWTSLKEILGEVSREDLLDTLFSKFCLGK